MRQPVQARSRDSTDRILDSALNVLAVEGLSALTTARVARDSGVSNGSIYHRFGNRRALVAGALERFIARLHAEVLQLRDVTEPPADLPSAMPLLIGTYQGLFTVHGGLMRAFFIDALSDPALADLGEQGKTLFAGQVAAFLSPYAAEITAPDPARAAEMLHRVLFGYFMMRTLFHDDFGDDAMLASLAHAALGLLDPVSHRPT